MSEEKRLAKRLVEANINGDKTVANEAHLAMLARVRANAGRLARTKVNDNG